MSLDTPLNGAADWTEAGPLDPISVFEVEHLGVLVATVRRHLDGFMEAGAALVEIRDSRLYRATYPTFEAFCAAEFGIGRAHAYRMIDAAEVVSPMGDTAALVANERQARALGTVPAEERADVMTAVAAGGKVTAKAIEDEVEARSTKPAPPPVVAPAAASTGVAPPPAPAPSPHPPVVAEQEPECDGCHRPTPAHGLYGGLCDACRIEAEHAASERTAAPNDVCHKCGVVDEPGTCGGICVDCAEKSGPRLAPAPKEKLPSERMWEPAKALGKGLRSMPSALEVMAVLPADSLESFDQLADEAIAWGKRWKEERKAAQRLRLMGVKEIKR